MLFFSNSFLHKLKLSRFPPCMHILHSPRCIIWRFCQSPLISRDPSFRTNNTQLVVGTLILQKHIYYLLLVPAVASRKTYCCTTNRRTGCRLSPVKPRQLIAIVVVVAQLLLPHPINKLVQILVPFKIPDPAGSKECQMSKSKNPKQSRIPRSSIKKFITTVRTLLTTKTKHCAEFLIVQ